MAIVHIRIDDRLIHGQVATMWINAIGVDRIMVIDDNAAKDDIMKMSLKLACPNGIALSVLSIHDAATRINAGNYENQRVFVVLRSVDSIQRLQDEKVILKKVNLGNLKFDDNKTKITNMVSLTEIEKNKIISLAKTGIEFTLQLTPVDASQDLISMLLK